jgi:hypothetical protein
LAGVGVISFRSPAPKFPSWDTLQEDHPETIGRSVADWIEELEGTNLDNDFTVTNVS